MSCNFAAVVLEYHKMGKANVDFMAEAIKCAVDASRHGDVPIGAVIVKGGKIIAKGQNMVQEKQDPTAHAEIMAIRKATRKIGHKFLDGCDIYVTLEPCAMCATAISFARMRRIIFAADDPKGGGILYGAHIYETDRHLWIPEVEQNNEYSNTSGQLLKVFFKCLRVKKDPKNELAEVLKKALKPTARQRARRIKTTVSAAKRTTKERAQRISRVRKIERKIIKKYGAV